MELEDGILVGQRVECCVNLYLVLSTILVLVEGVHTDHEKIVAINADARALADDLRTSHHVLHDGLLHVRESAGAMADCQSCVSDVLVQ